MSDEQWLCECGSTRCHDNTAELQGQLAERDKSLAEVNKRIMLCDEQHHRGYANLQKDIESARAMAKRLAQAKEELKPCVEAIMDAERHEQSRLINERDSAREMAKRLAEALKYYKETYDDKGYDEVAKEALALYDQWEAMTAGDYVKEAYTEGFRAGAERMRERAAKAMKFQIGNNLETGFDRSLVDGGISVIRSLPLDEGDK